jgi:O-antigen/teichoic acid export membrane protein
LQRLYRRSLFGLGAVGIVAAALLYAAADALVPALYGRSYAAGSSVLRILAPAVPLLCVNFALTHFLVALGLSCWNLALSALYLMTNLGANLLLVPARGMYGAAVAKLLTEVVLLASAYPLIHRRLEKAPP